MDDESDTDPAEIVVKAILDKKNRSGRCNSYYLIQWEDDSLEPSREPIINLHFGELLKEFETLLHNICYIIVRTVATFSQESRAILSPTPGGM